jgi:hypothetical protein
MLLLGFFLTLSNVPGISYTSKKRAVRRAADGSNLSHMHQVHMAAHIKTGSTWISLMIGRYAALRYAATDPIEACNVPEKKQWQKQSHQRQHCCAYFLRLPRCTEASENMPIFSGDKHLQQFRECTYKRHTLKCKHNISSAIRLLPPRFQQTTRFFLLVRDPRDVVVSMWYYKCAKNRALVRKMGRMGNGQWAAAYQECTQFDSLRDKAAEAFVMKVCVYYSWRGAIKTPT